MVRYHKFLIAYLCAPIRNPDNPDDFPYLYATLPTIRSRKDSSILRSTSTPPL
jgi:hypothetical protein